MKDQPGSATKNKLELAATWLALAFAVGSLVRVAYWDPSLKTAEIDANVKRLVLKVDSIDELMSSHDERIRVIEGTTRELLGKTQASLEFIKERLSAIEARMK